MQLNRIVTHSIENLVAGDAAFESSPVTVLRAMTKRLHWNLMTVLVISSACVSFAGEAKFQGRTVEEWLPGLSSPAPEAKQKAQAAIRLAGTNALPTLLRLIQSKDRLGVATAPNAPAASRLRTQAISGFEVLGIRALAAIPRLEELLLSGDLPFPVAVALTKIGPEGLMPLTRAMTSENDKVRSAAGAALDSLDSRATPFVAHLLKLCAENDKRLKIPAIKALGRIGQNPDESLPVLGKLLEDPDSEVRLAAVAAIGGYGATAKSHVASLIRLAKSADPATREAARAAAWRVDPMLAGQAGIPNPVRQTSVTGGKD